MTPNVYYLGTQVTLDGAFLDLNGNPIDPTTVLIYVRAPDGSSAQLTAQRVGPGVWNAPYTPVMNGLHLYRVIGSGSVNVSQENSFMVTSDFPIPMSVQPAAGSMSMGTNPPVRTP
jgi:hypothetical protein